MRLAALAATALLAVAAPAAAQTPAQPGPATLAFAVHAGIRDRGTTWVLKDELVNVHGILRPLVQGQVVTVVLSSRGKTVASAQAHVGHGGEWNVRLDPHQARPYTVTARHDATSQQAAASAPPQHFVAINGAIGHGGPDLRLLQVGLARLGYATPVDGSWGESTQLAVLAFRSVANLPRNTNPDRSVFSRLFRGEGGFRLRYPNAGRHVEFSWTHQVLVLADHGRPELIFHASSGKPSTPTVFGRFRFYRKSPGTNSEGMFDSSYFIGGYAVHGYPSVPTYPASHGCIRVPDSQAPPIFAWIQLGMQIFVYR